MLHSTEHAHLHASLYYFYHGTIIIMRNYFIYNTLHLRFYYRYIIMYLLKLNIGLIFIKIYFFIFYYVINSALSKKIKNYKGVPKKTWADLLLIVKQFSL